MDTLDLKQMSAMIDIIAEEKGLPKETVLGVIEQAIAAAWRKDNMRHRGLAFRVRNRPALKIGVNIFVEFPA